MDPTTVLTAVEVVASLISDLSTLIPKITSGAITPDEALAQVVSFHSQRLANHSTEDAEIAALRAKKTT